MASYQSDESGGFSFSIIQSHYPLTFQAKKEGSDKIFIPLKNYIFNQNTINLGELVFKDSSLSVSGYLVDQLGYPIEGIKIAIADDKEYDQKPVFTDIEGKFTIDHLTEGKIRLKANYKWEYYEHATFIAGTTNNRFVLQNSFENGRWVYPRNKKPLEGAKVQVTLIDAVTGKPVTGKDSHLQISGENISNPFINPDSSGKVALSVDGGQYLLEGDKYPDYETTSMEVDIESGQTYEFQLKMNLKSKLTGKITDSQGNPVDENNVKCHIYPSEYYGFAFPTISGDGTYEMVWDAEKFKSGRTPYLFIENEKYKCGRFYKLEIGQQQLDIVLEPAAHLVFEDKERLRVSVTFSDSSWDNPYLNTYLNTKETKENGLLTISGFYPIPEGLQYHVSVSENRQSKEATINPDDIVADQEIGIVLEDNNK